MHQIEAPGGDCGGVCIGKLLCFRIDAGLAGFDQPEKALLDLSLNFDQDSIPLVACYLSSIDSKIQRIPNFQKAQREEKNRL